MERLITTEDMRAASNLKKIYVAHKDKTGKGQVQVSSEMGITQGYLSQVLCGKVALINIRSLKQFAEYFNVNVTDIRDDIC